MIIRLSDNHYLDIDAYNHTLMEVTGNVDKKGNPADKCIGYFRDVESTIRNLVQLQVVGGNTEMNLREYLNALHSEFNRIKEYVDSQAASS